MQPAGSLPHKQQLATCSYAEPDLSSPCPHPTSQGSISILSSHPRVDFPSAHLPSGFSTKPLRVPLHSPVRATCPIHLISLDFITRIIFGENKTNVDNATCWKKYIIIITWYYSPTWALASSAIRLHWSLSWAFLLHPSSPISRRSSGKSSSRKKIQYL
jgi:hypothetical protein